MSKRKLIEFCTDCAEKIKDKNGYVSIRDILARFRINLEITPLLVEAMLASRPSRENKNTDQLEWLILADKDRFDISSEAIAAESMYFPLNPRFRNTIAHEALHSLSFRSRDVGFALAEKPRPGESKEAFVSRLERETEKLSPLLLIPNSRIAALLEIEGFNANSVADFQRSLGVSRDVFINRLALLNLCDPEDLKHNGHLENVVIGIGEWLGRDQYIFKKWPFYTRFADGMLPRFVAVRDGSIDLDVKEYLIDPEFCLCGGASDQQSFVYTDGHCKTSWEFVISVESSARKAGSRSLFIIRRR
jgi:hypothetical protein